MRWFVYAGCFKTKWSGAFLFGLLLLLFRLALSAPARAAGRFDPAGLVNPFIGTTRGGDTFPGATLPFGMVQLSPDMPLRELPNGGSEAYDYSGDFISGWSMTHLSGTGCWNYGDVFFTATTGPVHTHAAQYGFLFSHRQEQASPGYYRVFMKTWGINAQLTATLRCGMAKFTFPSGRPANILVPISHVMTRLSHPCYLHFLNNHTLAGYVTSNIFCASRSARVYFVLQSNQPWKSFGMWKAGQRFPHRRTIHQKHQNHKIGAYITYPAPTHARVVKLRIGISYVGIKGAAENLKAEVPGWSFSDLRQAARRRWNRALSVVRIRGGTRRRRVVFYTALYHTLLDPTVFDDANGLYRGYDNKIHRVPAGHRHIYANFSGWDIYRSEIPLLTLLKPRRVQDMAQSIVEMYKQTGFIYRWPAANAPGGCMVGDPLTSCLVRIWEAGLHGFDMKTAFRGMWHNALAHHAKYFRADANVSADEEYDISFAALSGLAATLRHPARAALLAEWAEQYREMFNPATGFMQPRLPNGAWLPGFNPAAYGAHFVEGTGWEYLWLAPQDVQGLVRLLGGRKAFAAKLTAFFSGHHYDPTNEPDIEAPFLYDYAGRPWQTQYIVNKEARKNYTDTPGGLAGGGNDDCGTMSAWYVLAQLGFYAVDPGTADFEICSPGFSRITLHLSAPYKGRAFTIAALRHTGSGQPGAAEYIQSALLDGKTLSRPWFTESAITNGGVWKVRLGAKPNRLWGAARKDAPPSLSSITGFGPVKYLAKEGYTCSRPTGPLTLNGNMAAYAQRVPRIIKQSLLLTNSHNGEETSVWLNRRVLLAAPWQASFDYLLRRGGADGFYLVVQNSRAGKKLLRGSDGSDKGLISGGMAPRHSLGVGVENFRGSELELAYGAPAGNTQRRMPVKLGGTAPVNFNRPDHMIHVMVSYDGARTLRFQATQSGKRFTKNISLPMPLAKLLASREGYIGLTGGTGALNETQVISQWRWAEGASTRRPAAWPTPAE